MRSIASVSLLLAGVALAAPNGNRMMSRRGASNSTGSDCGMPSVLPPVVPINTRSGDADLLTKLIVAPTQVDRITLLDQPGDFIFDFNPATAPPAAVSKAGLGGATVAANIKTFPALVGNNAAMTLAFLGPCGMNTPHVHPRATELNVVVKGRLVTSFIQENGARHIENTLSTYQMAIFPMGSIHQQFNPDCEETVFVGALNSADPGTSQVAQNFFGLSPDVVQATLGGVQTLNGEDIESFRSMIPANVALGIDSCLKKCGLKKNAKRDLAELLA